ncbi:hypothetical protein E2C01_022391 [Portunus trituberculatus]|uniref:Uncharacterized protein n=1 Tax=Portunus trituberculatus TaxID=210409 RepID=A0A5B7E5A7_PORTR|nr:hypothetical protein [Portunus trituberculatus]
MISGPPLDNQIDCKWRYIIYQAAALSPNEPAPRHSTSGNGGELAGRLLEDSAKVLDMRLKKWYLWKEKEVMEESRNVCVGVDSEGLILVVVMTKVSGGGGDGGGDSGGRK